MTIQEAESVAQRLPDGITQVDIKAQIENLSKVCILKTLWYPQVMDALEDSARSYLIDLGLESSKIECLGVPGSLELSLAASLAAQSYKYDFIVALGCVIKGETPHFDFVCKEVIAGLNNVSLENDLPVGMGVLTVNNLEQAIERNSKGREAAQAALYMSVFKDKVNNA